jgi:hypothetical protein
MKQNGARGSCSKQHAGNSVEWMLGWADGLLAHK